MIRSFFIACTKKRYTQCAILYAGGKHVKKTMQMRFGYIAALYDQASGRKTVNQLDLLERWLPGFLITEEAGRKPAYYDDIGHRIHACRVHGRLYCGNDARVTQILGRLIGTALGNQEKERRTAEQIQRYLSVRMMKEPELIGILQENADSLIFSLGDDAHECFVKSLWEAVFILLEGRLECSETERMSELFALDDDVFDSVLYNAVYQLNMKDAEGVVNAWLWLLLGGLLRNEMWHLLQSYDSSFTYLRRRFTDDMTLVDQILYMLEPEQYEHYFAGDDPDKRFPGIIWYCDKCGAEISRQAGFDDHLPSWTCRKCGYVNPISSDKIYDTQEDYQCGREPIAPEKIEDAVNRSRHR